MTFATSLTASQTKCVSCDRAIERRSMGHRQKYCSDACRKRSARSRVSCPEMVDQGVTADSPSEATFRTKLCSNISGLQRPKNALENRSVAWTRVNEVTWKLTDGEVWRTPASFGQWGGYNTERPVAWVMDIGDPKPLWYARVGDKSWGPTTSLNRAKAAALAIVNDAPLPEDEHAKSFTGPVDLTAVTLPPSDDGWLDWPADSEVAP